MSRVVVNTPQPLDARFVKEREQLQLAFGKRLRELRTEANLTLEMLADAADLHPNYVGSIERGERNVSLYNIWRIANGMGLTCSDLMVQLTARKGGRVLPRNAGLQSPAKG